MESATPLRVHRPRSSWLPALAALALAAFSATSLVMGAAYLGLLLPGGLPLGNLLAAVGLISLAYAGLVLSVAGSPARKFARGVVVLAAAWLPVSAILAGNLSLNFSGRTGDAWAIFSAVSFLAAFCAVAWAAGQRLVHRLRRRSNAGTA